MLNFKNIFKKLQAAKKEGIGLLEGGEIKEKGFKYRVPFELVAGLPLIEVEIAQKKYKFLFDTAALSVVPDTLIQTPSLKQLENIHINDSLDSLSDETLYSLNSLKVAGLEFCDFAVVTQDFSKQTPLCCLGFDGILGYNFLRNIMLSIDYENREIILYDKMPSTKGYTKTALFFDGVSGPKFEINFAFRNVLVTLDTGKNDGISLSVNDEFGSFNEYAYEKRETEGLFMSSFNGVKEYSQEIIYLVEDFKITNKIAIKSYPVSLNATSLSLVGNSFLENFNLILDFKKKQLYLRQYSDENIEKSFSSSFGFFVHWNETQKLYVSAMSRDSVASRAGLEIGDRILALGEMDTYEFSRDDYCEIFLALNSAQRTYESEDRLEMTIKNDTTIKRVLLKRKTIDEI